MEVELSQKRRRKKLICASETGLNNLEFILRFSKCYNSSKHHIAALCSSDFWFSFIYVWHFDRDLIISQISDGWLNVSGSDLVSSNETLIFSSSNSVFHIWLAIRVRIRSHFSVRARPTSDRAVTKTDPKQTPLVQRWTFFSPTGKYTELCVWEDKVLLMLLIHGA